ncbi:MAG: DUF748 domain-containing protein [Pseudomonadota bacterium]
MGEQKVKRSHLARNIVIGLGVLLAIYALAGFLLLPWWLQKQLPEQLDQTMGWQAGVEEIKTNPFTLTLDAKGFEATDDSGEPVVGFERLQVNVSFLQLLTGVIGFQDIRLTEPDIRVDLLEDYSVNYARDWRNANPPAESSDPGQEPDEQSSEPLNLYFSHISVDGGELLFRDFTQDEMAEFRITPLDLTINDLATWPDDEGDSHYSLLAAAGDQIIEWDGELSVAPLYSNGRIKLSDVTHETLGHFLAPVLPWQLRDGSVTLESRYRLSAGDELRLSTSEGRLTVSDLAMALSASGDEPAMTANNISVEGVGFDLAAKEAQVGMVSLDEFSIAANRNSAGVIDWVESLPAADESGEPDRSSGQSGTPFRWSVQGVELTNSRVQWRDNVPETPASIELTGLDLSVGGLSHRMDEPVSYRLSSSLASGGQFSANGQATPQPFTLEAALSGSEIALAVAEPYVQTAANLALADGLLSFDGNLDLDDQTDPMTGTFSGTAEVASMDMRLPEGNQPLVSWQTMQVAPIEFNVNPARLEIGTVSLVKPAFNIVRTADGLHNVETIAKAGPASADDEQPAKPEDTETSDDGKPAFIFRINELQVDTGALAYTDRTLEPPFSTTFDALNGSVTGISNVPPQQGRVNLQGQLAGVAPVDFRGTLGALGTEESSELELTMENLSLPVLSPYFGRYLGYGVDSGKLRLNLDYTITGTRLDATNTVVLDQMQLGQAVSSEQAVNAPVKLGLALLTDRQGIIEVDLPIEGDMTDPQFSVGQVVMRTFVNLLAKAATSPFSMLGSIADLAGFSSEELGQVGFEPGSVALGSEDAEKLSALADALKERPALLLEIRGAVAPEADGLALLKEQMAAAGEDVTDEAWEQARQAYLDGERSLPPETLGQLANRRALEVRRILEETHEVSDSQLFLMDTSRQAQLDDKGQVIVPFTLDVR